MSRRLAVVLVLAVLAGACSSGDEREDSGVELPLETETVPSTGEPGQALPAIPLTEPIYESLALDSPEEAVESLIAAYDDRDFVRAWFIFDADAQPHGKIP